MIHETIPLPVPGADGNAELVTYAPGVFPALGEGRLRPALIICPGGGYHCLSDREAEPVALRFAGLGFAAFVLSIILYNFAEKISFCSKQSLLGFLCK